MEEQSSLPLAGKRAFVTGASKGIGAAIARRFAAAGADLAIVGRNRSTLEAAAQTIREMGRDCLTIETDLGSQEGTTFAAECALAHAPVWDILINNAGVGMTAPLLEMTASAWDASMALNVRAPMLLGKALAPAMIAQKSGKIVNIASTAAFVGAPTGGAYAASKAALLQLTRTMAVEWGRHDIQTNAICPGITLTEMAEKFWFDPAHKALADGRLARIPAGRFASVDDVAELALFLAGPHSPYVNGLALPLDGGMLVTP